MTDASAVVGDVQRVERRSDVSRSKSDEHVRAGSTLRWASRSAVVGVDRPVVGRPVPTVKTFGERAVARRAVELPAEDVRLSGCWSAQWLTIWSRRRHGAAAARRTRRRRCAAAGAAHPERRFRPAVVAPRTLLPMKAVVCRTVVVVLTFAGLAASMRADDAGDAARLDRDRCRCRRPRCSRRRSRTCRRPTATARLRTTALPSRCLPRLGPAGAPSATAIGVPTPSRRRPSATRSSMNIGVAALASAPFAVADADDIERHPAGARAVAGAAVVLRAGGAVRLSASASHSPPSTSASCTRWWGRAGRCCCSSSWRRRSRRRRCPCSRRIPAPSPAYRRPLSGCRTRPRCRCVESIRRRHPGTRWGRGTRRTRRRRRISAPCRRCRRSRSCCGLTAGAPPLQVPCMHWFPSFEGVSLSLTTVRIAPAPSHSFVVAVTGRSCRSPA